VLTVNLSEPTNAALATTSVLGQIYDNDTPVGVTLPTDSLAAFQWHLYTVRAHWAWNIATGKGIKVGVLDQGVDRNNADLARNVNLSLGVNASNLQPGGNPIETGDNHGTAVAGVIGAARDGAGVVGVAYEATLVSIYTPSAGWEFPGEIANAFRYARDLDVLNNSWGFGNQLSKGTNWAFLDDAKSPLFAPAFAALKELADLGRKGLGTVVVQSAGNGFDVGDDTNLHNFQNSRYVVTVGATDYFSQVSDFSTTGASILVAAPGGGNDGRYGNILTADRIGAAGYTESSFAWLQGTSFAAPVVSGIVAMMLEVNPKLGYRDIQQILAMTARKVDTGLGEWGDNGATNWNGGGMHYNSVFHAVGFGQADALAAVRLAAGWDQPPLTSANVKEVSAGTTVQQAIPDGVDSVRSSLSITEKMVVERVDVTVNITHTFIGDLTILLLSPAGTLSYLMWRPAQGSLSAYGSSQDNVRFTFNTVLNWGESSVGTWSIQVSDKVRGEVGTFVDWSMTLIGQPESADDVYVYTNEYPDIVAQDPSRAVLRDTDGGINTINTAALGFGNLIDLTGQSSSALNGAPFSVAPGVKVGTVIGGDGGDVLIASDLVPTTLRGGPGNDLLVGGVLADLLIGGSGDDQLIGGAGNDRLDGGPGNDRLLGDQGFDSAVFPALRSQITVSLQVTAGLMQYRIAGPTIGTDTAAGIERLHFADMSIALDLEGNAGAAVRLVGALFGPQKVSDKSLLGQWIDAIDRGASLATAVTQAVGSAQFAAAAGGRSNADFVNLVYKNVVGTAPDPWSFDYFVGLLNRGEYTQPSLALLAVELELTGQQVGLVGLVNTGVEYIPVVG
jgi:subtilisin-like proprotein convertase family protein